ncbi:MAG: DUF1538 domain-containing protein [Clostridia bacterium]|nr:DUF1538 domain-containing protein [Clostridia bacterium]
MKDQLKEAVTSVLPLVVIMILLCFMISPFPAHALILFAVGALLLILGMALFTKGAETSIEVIGERIGVHLTKTRKIWLIILVSVFIGTIATVAEPDLKVLATQIPSINSTVLIWVVALGVGIFMAISFLRIILNIKFSHVFTFFYVILFVIAIFVPSEFWAVAFDAGGVTTGSITVPLMLALGAGVASMRENRKSESDSFGISGICSIGPIITVLLLGLFYPLGETTYDVFQVSEFHSLGALIKVFLEDIPIYMKEVATSLLPIVAFFAIYQVVALKLSKKELIRIGVGLVYTFVGVTLFLTGANVGFVPVGNLIGMELASSMPAVLVGVIATVIGYFIARAEPAIVVLNKQVNDITDGAIPEKVMVVTLSIGIAASVTLSVIRVYTGISLMWFLIPGYALSLILSFVVPEIFTAIAFDSGGIASGTIEAAFLSPFIIGVCEVVGGNVMTDALGFLGISSLTPILSVQVLGLIYMIRSRKAKSQKTVKAGEEEIIDL